MTPEQVAALVSSKRSADRRLAGREIAANPTLVDRSVIEAAFYGETVPQIRQQFASALEALSAQAPVAAEPPAAQAKAIYDEAYVKSLRHVTECVLHQLNPLIGDIEQKAAAEIVDFQSSETKTRIGQIKLQVEAIAKLYSAAKAAVIEEFDLATVIRDCLPMILSMVSVCSVLLDQLRCWYRGIRRLSLLQSRMGCAMRSRRAFPWRRPITSRRSLSTGMRRIAITGYRSSMKVSASTAASPGLSRLAQAARATADTACRKRELRWFPCRGLSS